MHRDPRRATQAQFAMKNGETPFPYLSMYGAIGFVASVLALAILELTLGRDSTASPKTRMAYVMICLLLAGWSSVVSLITAWCPIILGGDRRPWIWVIALIVGWIAFLTWFDIESLVLPADTDKTPK